MVESLVVMAVLRLFFGSNTLCGVPSWIVRGYLPLSRLGKVEQPSTPRPTGQVEEAMPKLDGYLRIKEAAEYLGVSPNTLRNWGRSGKLAERRHPINGYRLYAPDELESLLEQAERTGRKSSRSRRPK
jgi:excisionase family DNA binding protein